MHKFWGAVHLFLVSILYACKEQIDFWSYSSARHKITKMIPLKLAPIYIKVYKIDSKSIIISDPHLKSSVYLFIGRTFGRAKQLASAEDFTKKCPWSLGLLSKYWPFKRMPQASLHVWKIRVYQPLMGSYFPHIFEAEHKQLSFFSGHKKYFLTVDFIGGPRDFLCLQFQFYVFTTLPHLKSHREQFRSMPVKLGMRDLFGAWPAPRFLKSLKKLWRPPEIIVTFFYLQVIALRVKRNNDWKTWTYERYLREVQLAARGKTFLPIFIKNIYFFNIYLFLGFIHLGLARHHSVAIIGANSPEWVISDLAAIFAG